MSIKNSIIFITFISLTFFSIACTAQTSEDQNSESVELSDDVITQEDQAALTPEDILQGLKDGNERFMNNNLTARDYPAQIRATTDGQYPEAVVIACIDSRVPVENIFDKGVGDIFCSRGREFCE